MSNLMTGIVKSVTKSETTLEVETGETLTFPRNFGEAPAVNSVVVVDTSAGGLGHMYTTPPIAKVGETKRYMNFYAVEADENVPDVHPDQSPMKTDETFSTEIAPFSPFGFVDTPSGSRTLASGNGNMVFAGSTAVGIVNSCESKVIVKDDGTAEFITHHFMGLLGRTISVSSFHDNITIEIDITKKESSGGTGNLDSLKTRIANLIIGEDGDPMTYEQALKQTLEGDPNKPFFDMFGLFLGELLLSFKWERLKYRGNEQTFHEVFGGLGQFDTVYIYCQNCYGKDSIASLEFFLQPGTPTERPERVNIPNCETDAHPDIMPLGAYFNGEQYEAYAMNMTLKSGSVIEYSKSKRIYSLSHGIIARASWNSAQRHALFAENFHANIDVIAFPDISILPNAPGYCGSPVGLPTITWGGDFTLNVLGDATILASGSATLYGGDSTIIGGGTKGIQVDSTGSSAVTL